MYLSDSGVASHPQFKSLSNETMENRRKSPPVEEIVCFQYRLDGLKQKSRLSDHTQMALNCESQYATDDQPAMRGHIHHTGV